MPAKSQTLSIIIPVYNEEQSIEKLYSGIKKNINDLITKKLITKYEILFIDDGSTDKSVTKIKKLTINDDNVKLLPFRRNFGKSKALQCGFYYASGDIIITMDADLQDDPNEFKNFIQKINEGYDLVSGWKHKRHDPLEKTLPSKLFNFVTSKFSGINIHDFNCGFKAYRKEVVKSIQVYGEFHRYIPVLALRNGFKVGEIEVKHHARSFGKSKYGFERYLNGLFDAISSIFLLKFYEKPMYFFGKMGIILTLIGFLICSYLTILWFAGNAIGGRPLLILGVLFILVGFQSFSLGLLSNIIVDNKNQKENIQFLLKNDTESSKNEL